MAVSPTAMLKISNNISIPLETIELNAIRAQGAGGQNVNKVSSAIHLRFNLHNGILPDFYVQRLLAQKDHRITKDGMVIIKAQRSQEKNREDALLRLQALIQSVKVQEKKRIATKPSKSSQTKRMDKKNKHGQKKVMRGKVSY